VSFHVRASPDEPPRPIIHAFQRGVNTILADWLTGLLAATALPGARSKEPPETTTVMLVVRCATAGLITLDRNLIAAPVPTQGLAPQGRGLRLSAPCKPENLMAHDSLDDPQPGGCRRFVIGGCQLAFAGYLLLFLLVVIVLFVMLWAIQFVWGLA
jgi:hypothetical protein